MEATTKEQSGKLYQSHRYILVVSLFIVSASLLVVLTTFAINMLTSTGDFNRLLVQYNHQTNDRDKILFNYIETGDTSYKVAYQELLEHSHATRNVVDELLDENPKPELIFEKIQVNRIHPNEITGLIRIFTFFSEKPEVKELKKNWARVKTLNMEKRIWADSLLSEDYDESGWAKEASVLRRLNEEINTHILKMIEGNSTILLLLKNYSLWATVLLGILIVLIGVIFTVRGVKQIDKLKKVLHQRDYLALFPELNQHPVLNISSNGQLQYVNQATYNLFPDLRKQGINHPFLKEVKDELPVLHNVRNHSVIKEVKVGESYYQQAINYLSKEKGIHVHSFDITTIKEQQNEISKSLAEKNMLLAEVHHRVKNNMAVISSLLELQEMLGDDPNTALAESRSRIKSMAIVHELLYQSDSLSEIVTHEYLEKISMHLKRTFPNVSKADVDQSAPSQKLNINQAVPLGLLINELVLFICHQAISPEQSFDLALGVHSANNHLCLQLSASLPQTETPLASKNHAALRGNLIENLLEQIEAELKVPDTDHLVMQIWFKPSDKSGSSSSYL